MVKVFRVLSVGLAGAMVLAGVLTSAASKPVRAAACIEPSSCDPDAISLFCNCMDTDTAACIASLTDSLCGGTGACGDDSRVNTNCSAPEILYCNGDNAEFYLYNYATGKGTFHFSIPLADLNTSVEVKTLVKQVGQVKVYLNPDGTVELLAPQPDGKIYFMVFDPSDCASQQEGADWGLE